MAVSGKTAVPYEFPYLLESDIPDMGAGDKAVADKLQVVKWLSQSLKPTIGLKNSTSTLALTTSYQEVPGTKLEITPVVSSVLAVVIVPVLFAEAGTTAFATIKVDTTNESQTAEIGMNAQGTITPAQVYLVSLSAAKHTITMQAEKSGSGSAQAQINSRLLYALFAS